MRTTFNWLSAWAFPCYPTLDSPLCRYNGYSFTGCGAHVDFTLGKSGAGYERTWCYVSALAWDMVPWSICVRSSNIKKNTHNIFQSHSQVKFVGLLDQKAANIL